MSTCHGGSKGTSRGLPSQPNVPYTGCCNKPQVLCAICNTNTFPPPEWLRIRQFFSAGWAKVTRVFIQIMPVFPHAKKPWLECRSHLVVEIQWNICTHEGIVGDRGGWVSSQVVGPIHCFIQPVKEYVCMAACTGGSTDHTKPHSSFLTSNCHNGSIIWLHWCQLKCSTSSETDGSIDGLIQWFQVREKVILSMFVLINPAKWVTGELLWRWPIEERDKILVGFLHGLGIVELSEGREGILEDGGIKLSQEKRKGRVRGTDVEEGIGTHPWRGRGMVVLHEHLHIFFMAGEAEDMRPGGSLNTTDIGIHPGFNKVADLAESLNSQDLWIILHANHKGWEHLVDILMGVSHRQEGYGDWLKHPALSISGRGDPWSWSLACRWRLSWEHDSHTGVREQNRYAYEYRIKTGDLW